MTVIVGKMEDAGIFHQEETLNNISGKRRHPCLIFGFVLFILVIFGLSIWIVYLHLWGIKGLIENKDDLIGVSELKSAKRPLEGKAPAGEVKAAPRFFENANFQGRYYLAPPGWETSDCVNLPAWANDIVLSVNTGGHCIQVFEHQKCSHLEFHSDVGVNDKLFPGSFGHDDLGVIGMDKRISSFRRC